MSGDGVVSRGEAATVTDDYRRRTFQLASAAKRLAEVTQVVQIRGLAVPPAAVADLEYAKRVVAALNAPAAKQPKSRDDNGNV